LGTVFEADFRFFVVVWVVLEQSVQLTVGMEIEVQYSPYSSTDLAQKTRQNLVGLFWCCEVFSLAGNVYLLLFCTFLKLNNNISLSLLGLSHLFSGIS
jgi:hypothetical protein